MRCRPPRRLRFLALLGAACGLAGCDLGPGYRPPALDVPSGFRDAAPGQQADWPSAGWWRGFRSATLNQLITEAEVFNFDVAAAVARVRQADAAVRIAGAALLPTLSATGSANWQQAGFSSRVNRGFALSGGTITTHNYTLGANAAYVADFWGENRALTQAAVASAVSSRYAVETVRLSTLTAVAQTWFTALAFADRIAVARQNLRDAERSLAVIRGRLEAGTATALDLDQQLALVQTERANIPALQSQLEQQLIGLGILTGRPPEQITARPGTLLDLAVPHVWPGLPSALLRRRPDVANAEAQLIASNFDIKAARAAFFPTISLTASRGYEAAALASVFTPGGIIASLAASLTQPVFDGGALRGQLEQNRGRYAELLADYGKSVVQAFTDVDNALTAWRYTSEQEVLQQRAVQTARRAAEAAAAQIEAGTADVTTLLTTETTLFTDEDALVQIRLARFVALLDLYQALGGGWQQPNAPIMDQFPGLDPGLLRGGVALPVDGNT